MWRQSSYNVEISMVIVEISMVLQKDCGINLGNYLCAGKLIKSIEFSITDIMLMSVKISIEVAEVTKIILWNSDDFC